MITSPFSQIAFESIYNLNFINPSTKKLRPPQETSILDRPIELLDYEQEKEAGLTMKVLQVTANIIGDIAILTLAAPTGVLYHSGCVVGYTAASLFGYRITNITPHLKALSFDLMKALSGVLLLQLPIVFLPNSKIAPAIQGGASFFFLDQVLTSCFFIIINNPKAFLLRSAYFFREPDKRGVFYLSSLLRKDFGIVENFSDPSEIQARLQNAWENLGRTCISYVAQITILCSNNTLYFNSENEREDNLNSFSNQVKRILDNLPNNENKITLQTLLNKYTKSIETTFALGKLYNEYLLQIDPNLSFNEILENNILKNNYISFFPFDEPEIQTILNNNLMPWILFRNDILLNTYNPSNKDLHNILTKIRRSDSPEVLFDNPSSKEELNRRYRQLALITHPDKHATTNDHDLATKLFQCVQKAHDMCRNLFIPH